MPTSFEIVSAEETHTHVRVRGPLDIAGAGALSLKFTAATAGRKRHVLVEMADVDFVSSIGLGMLVQVARALNADGKKVVLIAPNPAVAGVIRTAKLDAVMPIADSTPSAISLIR
jgi:anti-anti-sigma factor